MIGSVQRSIAISIILLMLFASAVFADLIARVDFDSNLNLTSMDQTPPPGSFSSSADGFETYQLGVSDSIPFTLIDDSIANERDPRGIINAATKSDAWFGLTDTKNDDNPEGEVTASWVLDIANASQLQVSIDMGAWGDFETSDRFDWSYSIDGGPMQPLFESSVDQDGMHTYTKANGDTVDLNDPLYINGDLVDNQLKTYTADVSDSGQELMLLLSAATDGGEEGYVFDNILITGAPGGITGDFDANGVLDDADIDALSEATRAGGNVDEFDLTGDGILDEIDRIQWVEELKKTFFGDSNLDGEFNSADFVLVFQRGEYEDEVAANSIWSSGDWNGDGEFNSSDFVLAFQGGGFETGPRPATMPVPEPASALLFLSANCLAVSILRKRCAATPNWRHVKWR